MVRKSFFAERNERDISKLEIYRVENAKGLVNRILELNPNSEGLELRLTLTPEQFTEKRKSAEASRKNLKHGQYIELSQPTSRLEAYRTTEIPLAIRERDFSKLQNISEDEINFLGYSFKPVQCDDKRLRVVPFAYLLEGARIFAYAENKAGGIDITPYDDSKRVKYGGANIICTIPSREQKQSRYKINLQNVPIDNGTEKRGIIWGIKSDFEKAPEHKLHNIKYNYPTDKKDSDVITFYPQEIAAYLGVIKHYWDNNRNITPLEMNPFALPSKKEAEFYMKLCNNIVVYDETLSSKNKLRKLHLDEKCILIARSIGLLGANQTMYCDSKRDGHLADYDWKMR